jgi:Fic family protein
MGNKLEKLPPKWNGELVNIETKEVLNYKDALWRGIDLIQQNNILTTNMIVEIQSLIEENNAGVRTQSGTVLMNDRTGEVIYTPPGNETEIRELLWNLEQYINIDDEVDPLIKLAIIHYQFESIHPFYDGNGRTGRIVNELYLVMKELLRKNCQNYIQKSW